MYTVTVTNFCLLVDQSRLKYKHNKIWDRRKERKWGAKGRRKQKSVRRIRKGCKVTHSKYTQEMTSWIQKCNALEVSRTGGHVSWNQKWSTCASFLLHSASAGSHKNKFLKRGVHWTASKISKNPPLSNHRKYKLEYNADRMAVMVISVYIKIQ